MLRLSDKLAGALGVFYGDETRRQADRAQALLERQDAVRVAPGVAAALLEGWQAGLGTLLLAALLLLLWEILARRSAAIVLAFPGRAATVPGTPGD